MVQNDDILKFEFKWMEIEKKNTLREVIQTQNVYTICMHKRILKIMENPPRVHNPREESRGKENIKREMSEFFLQEQEVDMISVEKLKCGGGENEAGLWTAEKDWGR